MSGRARPTRIAALRPIVRACLALTCVALIWSVLQLDPWLPAAKSRDFSDERPRWTAVNPIGVNTFLAREVEDWKRDKTLEMIAAMGAGWIKEHFAWQEIEPEDNVYWDAKYQQETWAKYDAIVDGAAARGLRVIARIDQTPAWARPLGSDPTAPPTDMQDFGDFIADFVEHFRGRVQFIQIWNEPNLAAEWGGEIDPEGYAEMLKTAAQRARAVDPNIVILSAPMAMTTENSGRAMSDLDYWQALYDAGARDSFDIVSANAYGLDRRYDDSPDIATLNVRRVELLRDLLVRNRDASKPIWFNEYGWNAAPADFPTDELTWSRVSEIQQADWTVGGIEYAREEWLWFGVANVWYFRHVGSVSYESADHYFRMVDVEFTPREVYRAVADLGDDITVAGPGAYNDLEAPLRAYGTWPVHSSGAASGGEYLVGNSGSLLAIAFRGSSVHIQLGPGQRATSLRVWTEDGRPNGTEALEGGGRVVQVPDGSSEVAVFDRLETAAPEVRTVFIEVTGDAALLVDGFSVESKRSLRTVTLLAAVLVALALVDVGVGRKSSR